MYGCQDSLQRFQHQHMLYCALMVRNSQEDFLKLSGGCLAVSKAKVAKSDQISAVRVVSVLDSCGEHFNLRERYGKVVIAYTVKYVFFAEGQKLVKAFAGGSRVAEFFIGKTLIENGVRRLVVIVEKAARCVKAYGRFSEIFCRALFFSDCFVD